jgi:chemotaxis protein MotA
VDWASVAGLLLALAGILLGQALEGGKLGSLLQPAAFIIVFVGTLGAVMLQSRRAQFSRGVKMLAWVFRPPPDQRKVLMQDIALWSLTARREGLLSLERFMRSGDPGSQGVFITKGLRLIVDGIAPAKIREILEYDISGYETEQRQAIKIWESAGGYSPTIGILGAVLGLVHVMENLSEPAKLGSGIAVAFIATIYGVGLANLVFLPISNKLKGIVSREIDLREFLISVFSDIASGDNSRVVEERLTGLMRE